MESHLVDIEGDAKRAGKGAALIRKVEVDDLGEELQVTKMVPITTEKTIVGLSRGSVILLKVVHRPAPSMAAAS